MGGFFDSLKGAFGKVVTFAGDAADWTADVVSDLASISGNVSDLIASTQDPGAVVLQATTPGISPTYLAPTAPPTVATSGGNSGLVWIAFLGLLGLIVYSELKK